MPNKPTVSTAETDPGPQLLLEDDTEVQEVVDPQQVALRELAIHAASATGPLSLLFWKHHRTELTDVTDPQSVEALGLERGIPLNKAAETLLTEKGVIDPNDPVVAGLRQAQSLHTTAVATPYIEDLQVIDRFTAAREKLEQGQLPAQVAADFRQQVERIVRRLNR